MKPSVIFMGSKPGAVAALLHLHQSGWDVKEVVAADSEPKWLPKPSLKEVAKKLKIPTVTCQSEIQSAKVDLVISYMFRALVKTNVIQRGKYAVNFHAAPLPSFGGWAFYNVAILEGASEYGCTCHIMDESFDHGPIVRVKKFKINANQETALSLEKKAQKELIKLFCKVTSEFEAKKTLKAVPQNETEIRYLSKNKFQRLKKIPQHAKPKQIEKVARAFWYPPYELAYYRIPGMSKIEVIPERAKETLAQELHKYDLQDLLKLTKVPQHFIKQHLAAYAK